MGAKQIETKPTIGHIVIGNSENRRITFFQDALLKNNLPPALVVPYADLLRSALSCQFEPTASLLHPVLRQLEREFPQVGLRIDSAGENFEVERLLIAAGADYSTLDDEHSACSKISQLSALRLQPDRGRLRYLRQHALGFLRLLEHIGAVLKFYPKIKIYNAIPPIVTACDKTECHRHLEAAGIAVAPAFHGIRSFEQLYESAKQIGWERLFVKHQHGSSAAGVIALDVSHGHLRAVTSMEAVGNGKRTRYYNNLKLRVYTSRPEIARLVDYLCAEGVHVEQWLPRAGIAGRVIDLRIVSIAGRACHTVVRTSNSPITNLHLGNRRGDLELLRRSMGESAWRRTIELVESTAATFPAALYLGIDLLLQPSFRHPTIIEVNAFGDLLPNVAHEEKSTHELEVDRFISRAVKLRNVCSSANN